MQLIERQTLLVHLRQQFLIDLWGHHGNGHWARVRANGLLPADQAGANRHVDNGHGARGAALARELKGRYFEATDDELDMLSYACTHHSDGLIYGE